MSSNTDERPNSQADINSALKSGKSNNSSICIILCTLNRPSYSYTTYFVMTNTHYQQNRPNIDNSIQGCPCSICSRIRYNNQTTRSTIEYQDPLVPIVRTKYSTASLSCLLSKIISQESIIPYANQNFGGDYPSGTAAIVGGQSQVWPVAPQALVGSHIIVLYAWLNSSSSRIK